MATHSENTPEIDPTIRRMLRRLRWRIRAYVWLQGLAVLVVWLGVTFWAALALDYLPILVGATEMPRAARGVLLALIAGVAAYLLYRYILRRAFARLSDENMAVLLERRYRDFNDSLVTSVELGEHPDHAQGFNAGMLAHTRADALSRTGEVKLGRVFNFSPLLASAGLALLLLLSVGLFYSLNTAAANTALRRLYLLEDDLWPRKAHIEVVGLEVQRRGFENEGAPQTDLVRFSENHSLKVARGANLALRVRASAAAPAIPETCVIYYQTADGESGSVNMQKLGQVRDGYQQFAFDGKPLEGVLSSLEFNVLGYDHRTPDYSLQVVESPVLANVRLQTHYPDYIRNEELGVGFDREIDFTPGVALPEGTSFTLRASTNKPLRRAIVLNASADEQTIIEAEGAAEFALPVENLRDDLTLQIVLLDEDGVYSESPERLFIAARPDEPPQFDSFRLEGIGVAITPQAQLPARGEVQDDYGVASAWFEVQPPEGEARRIDFAPRAGGEIQHEIDFRELASQETSDENRLQLEPGQQIVFLAKAADKYNLSGGPNVGASDQFQLDVVTPDQLLIMLERRELGHRRHFEQIVDQVTEMRDSLLHVLPEENQATGAEPGDAAEPEDEQLSPEQQAQRERSLRALRVQRALQQSQTSQQEVRNVAEAFDAIRLELVNNRVDTEDRKTRLKEQIADPLRQISDEMFPVLTERLRELETKIGVAEDRDAAAEAAIAQANDVLNEMDAVLQRMLDLETYNELVDLVRSLVEEQEALINETKEQQKQEVLDLLQ